MATGSFKLSPKEKARLEELAVMVGETPSEFTRKAVNLRCTLLMVGRAPERIYKVVDQFFGDVDLRPRRRLDKN